MNFKVLLVVLFSVSCMVHGQTVVVKQVIDSFQSTTPTILITVASTSSLPVTETAFTTGSDILGGERDLQLVATSGETGSDLSSGVSQSSWSVSATGTGAGYAIMQYDGVNGNSFALSANGLGAVNFTQDGGNAFRVTVTSTFGTTLNITVYSPSGTGVSSVTVAAASTNVLYTLPFTSFTGQPDFTRVGAIQVGVQAVENVDIFISSFVSTGPATANPSATATPAVVASSSVRPVVAWYQFDDDDNGQSPCGEGAERISYFLNPEQLVYYYFYGFPDPPVRHYTANSASTLALSGLLSLVVLAVTLF